MESKYYKIKLERRELDSRLTKDIYERDDMLIKLHQKFSEQKQELDEMCKLCDKQQDALNAAIEQESKCREESDVLKFEVERLEGVLTLHEATELGLKEQLQEYKKSHIQDLTQAIASHESTKLTLESSRSDLFKFKYHMTPTICTRSTIPIDET